MGKKISLIFILFVFLFLVIVFVKKIFFISPPLIKPHQLKPGDTVALVASASPFGVKQDVDFAIERLQALGLHVILGKTVYQQDGYFAGTDRARAADLNAMFANPKVKAIFEVRGGWGCARILPYLDYNLIRKNPKILIGFSDITALLLAIEEHSGLVTFHGPLAAFPWPDFTVKQLKKILFNGTTPVTLKNPTDEVDITEDIIQAKDKVQTLSEGTAKGVLIGGNLSIVVSLLGTPYEPDWRGKILFLEDVGEPNYRIDRMMSQLALADVFKKINGLVFGTCFECYTSYDYLSTTFGSFPIAEIIQHYTKSSHIPVFMGSMIGHAPEIFTLPEGVNVEINAKNGSIKLLESAVLNG